MRKDTLYKHDNNTDVAFQPHHIFYIAEKGQYLIKCTWYNIVNPNNIYKISDNKIRVKQNDMKRWRPYDTSK